MLVSALYQFFIHKINIFIFFQSTKNQYENLSPILTVLNKSSRGCRAQRKYLRQVVLPPLRDVSRPPEKGKTLRNQLCRLLTTPVTSVRDLVAEFLFILCKEKGKRRLKWQLKLSYSKNVIFIMYLFLLIIIRQIFRILSRSIMFFRCPTVYNNFTYKTRQNPKKLL